MKISSREDINRPASQVYAAVADFDAIERQIRGRGVSLDREDGTPDGPGRRWAARASWRGRHHDIASELTALEIDRGYTVVSRSGGVVCTTTVDVVALSQTRTRLLVAIDLRPTTLSSRLLVHSLKLAKGRLAGRLKLRLEEFAQRLEREA